MATPQVMIQHSDDGGYTWSHEEWKPLVGDSKNYLCRVRLQRQGSCYQRIYRLTFTEDAPFSIISAHADITVGV